VEAERCGCGWFAWNGGAKGPPLLSLRRTAIEVRRALSSTAPFGVTDQLLVTTLQTFFPSPSTHELARDGKLHVSVTVLGDRTNPWTRREIVTEWRSADDLFGCVRASCFIPRYSAPSMSTTWRSRQCVDGGVFSICPRFPGHELDTVRVSPFPDKPLPVLGTFEICPSTLPGSSGGDAGDLARAWLRLGRSALNPTPAELERAFDSGRRAAEAFVLSNRGRA
jgi:hypothetical protein